MKVRLMEMIGMILLLLAIIGILLYLGVCWRNQCKLNHMCFPKKDLDVINLGSTYAFYDFDYKNLPVKGMNLANIPQYLDYDYMILKKYIKYLKQAAKVLIVIPDFDFIARQTPTNKKVYYEALLPWEIRGFSIVNMIKYIFNAAKEPFTHQYQKERSKWDGYVASYEETEKHAKRRVSDWEGKLGVPCVKSGTITNELKERIAINIQEVHKIIELCFENGAEPVIIIPPVSSIMKQCVSVECLRSYLYNPLEEVRKSTKIRIFDYMCHEEFNDVDLYLNSDCLNQKGANLFMEKVYEDIWC